MHHWFGTPKRSDTLKVERLQAGARIPERAPAGYNIYACLRDEESNTVTIDPHSWLRVPTGIALRVKHGYFACLAHRSGMPTHLYVPASFVDNYQRAEVYIPIKNRSDRPMVITHGQCIARIFLIKHESLDVELVNAL
jgi:dUTPase